MTTVQTLLDAEAGISNSIHDLNTARAKLHKEIIALRGDEPPHCYGEDDCSTNCLSMCPWRLDCGDTPVDPI